MSANRGSFIQVPDDDIEVGFVSKSTIKTRNSRFSLIYRVCGAVLVVVMLVVLFTAELTPIKDIFAPNVSAPVTSNVSIPILTNTTTLTASTPTIVSAPASPSLQSPIIPAPVLGRKMKSSDMFSYAVQPRPVAVLFGTIRNRTVLLSRTEVNIIARDAMTGEETVLLTLSELPFNVDSFLLSPNGEHVLIGTNSQTLWRYSVKQQYVLYTFKTRSYHWLHEKKHIALMYWAPTSDSVAFVSDNNVYLTYLNDVKQSIALTTDGKDDEIFNGIADWVYEEEVFSSANALFWSPDGSALSYVQFNDSRVPQASWTVYGPVDEQGNVPSYSHVRTLRYPKVAYPLPKVSVRVVHLQTRQHVTLALPEWPLLEEWTPSSSASDSDHVPETETEDKNAALKQTADVIIGRVQWFNATHVMVRLQDRLQKRSQTLLYNVNDLDRDAVDSHILSSKQLQGSVILKRQSLAGWLNTLSDELVLSNGFFAMLRVVNDRPHIALYDANKPLTLPKMLTFHEFSRPWQVTHLLAYCDDLKEIYYEATEDGGPHQRHLYAVNIFTGERRHLSSERPGVYTAKFDDQARIYVEYYMGPEAPTVTVKMLHAMDGDMNMSKSDLILERNAHLTGTSDLALPNITFGMIPAGDFEIPFRALFPPGFDAKKEASYGLLLRPYGGPDSQQATMRYNVDYSYLAVCAERDVIVLIVDGRGTGANGDAYLKSIYGHFGEYEAIDQLTAVAWMLQQYPSIDARRVAIQGWSFGGYLSAKLLELDSPLLRVAVSVAPVTAWPLYDAVYTERYMSLPALNPTGYQNSAVVQTTGFRQSHHAHFLLVHGLADDNVHLSHSARLVRLLLDDSALVSIEEQFFPDSDHSIRAGKHDYIRVWDQLHSFLRRTVFDPEAIVVKEERNIMKIREAVKMQLKEKMDLKSFSDEEDILA